MDKQAINDRAPVMDLVSEEDFDWHEHIATMLGGKWLIIGTFLLFLLGGLFYAWVTDPVYQADTMLQIEQQNRGSGIEALLLEDNSKSPAEIEIVSSRTVIGAVIDELGLTVKASPRYFPVIGKAIARGYRGSEPREAILGLSEYAWGGEAIKVQRLDVPGNQVNYAFQLVAKGEGRFTLYNSNGEAMLEGRVGEPAIGSDGVSIFVSVLKARPGTEFAVQTRQKQHVINELQNRLIVADKGRQSGMITIAYQDADPALAAAIVNTLANRYLRQNVERRSEEAEKMLAFLDLQLPKLKANLDTAEAAVSQYRIEHGTIDLSAEAQSLLAQVADLEKKISDLELQKSEFIRKFTPKHPAIIALNQKLETLQATRDDIDDSMRDLPGMESQSLQLARNVTVANELYMLVMNKIQELRIAKAGTIGNVRIIDAAYVADSAVAPNKKKIVLIAVVLGLLMGIALAFLKRSLQRGIVSPDVLERKTGLPVYASVPHSVVQHKNSRNKGAGAGEVKLLTVTHPKDLSIESLRSLRTSLQFAMLQAERNIISITGPSPSIGKSFITTNLAVLLAESGKRTLVIDGDMRKGYMHQVFSGQRENGLSESISGGIDYRQAIRSTFQPNLFFLSSGQVPPNPSELLMSDRFNAILSAVSEMFDVVLIDTPPILAVTDAGIIGRYADVNLMVLKSGQHPINEINHAVRVLKQNGVATKGFILNDITTSTGKYGYYGQYGYNYQYKYE